MRLRSFQRCSAKLPRRGFQNRRGDTPYQNDHEDANGQFEMNWEYDDALKTTDKHSFFKFMVVAEKHGLRAPLMPKPFKGLTGNGCHCHISVWDREGRINAFVDKSAEFGLSNQGRKQSEQSPS
jgi:glutamine synthetase